LQQQVYTLTTCHFIEDAAEIPAPELSSGLSPMPGHRPRAFAPLDCAFPGPKIGTWGTQVGSNSGGRSPGRQPRPRNRDSAAFIPPPPQYGPSHQVGRLLSLWISFLWNLLECRGRTAQSTDSYQCDMLPPDKFAHRFSALSRHPSALQFLDSIGRWRDLRTRLLVPTSRQIGSEKHLQPRIHPRYQVDALIGGRNSFFHLKAVNRE